MQAHSHASWMVLVPVLWPKLRTGPSSSHLSVCMVLSPIPAAGYSRVWIQPPHLPHTRVRAGGYLPSPHYGIETSAGGCCPAQHVACQWREGWSCRTFHCSRWLRPSFPFTACCGPHAGPCEDLRRRCCWCAPEGALAAAFLHTCTYCLYSLPLQSDSSAAFRRSSPWLRGVAVADMKVDGRWCTPEGTPALRLLLRCAACCPCTTLVGMSPSMLRACGAACCLRCFAGGFMRCVLARDALAYLSRLPPALVAPADAALHSASPSSASSASSASSVSLPAAASISSLPR